MDFGKQIKQMRLERKLTQEQLANHLGVSRQAVSNWENNKNLPDLELIIAISKLFSVSLDDLILIHRGFYMKTFSYCLLDFYVYSAVLSHFLQSA